MRPHPSRIPVPFRGFGVVRGCESQIRSIQNFIPSGKAHLPANIVIAGFVHDFRECSITPVNRFQFAVKPMLHICSLLFLSTFHCASYRMHFDQKHQSPKSWPDTNNPAIPTFKQAKNPHFPQYFRSILLCYTTFEKAECSITQDTGTPVPTVLPIKKPQQPEHRHSPSVFTSTSYKLHLPRQQSAPCCFQ